LAQQRLIFGFRAGNKAMNPIPTVLVVEDDIHISKLIAVLMSEANYRALTAGTAKHALGLIAQSEPDLVILDWMLPDMLGDELCRVIKARTAAAFLPVLMLTARSTMADRIAGFDAGADDYVTKPFHNDELLARARALLRIRAAELAQAATLIELEQQHQELKIAYEQLRSTQAQLVQTSKLAALGELVAGVAHELNNPLAIVLGNAELLANLDNEEDRRSVQQIIDATHRGRRVLQSLVTFARHDKVEADWHHPRDLLDRVLDLKRSRFETGEIGLDVYCEPDLPMLWADAPQIQQVLLNILINAEQALAGRSNPQIVVRIYRGSAPIEQPAVLPNLVDNRCAANGEEFIVFDIADNGPGLQPQIIDRLFEPFVTTRPVGQGTGMGLAISYAIISQHGGTIQVASLPDQGATFRVAVPIRRDARAREHRPAAATAAARAAKVLVIDDEPAIVDLVSRLLARDGYTVAGALRASRALENLQREQFDFILCDMRMPDMDGITFYQQLNRDLPTARFILMTGDTSNVQAEQFLAQHQLAVLRKPFTRQELLAVLATDPPK
jgi:DNA-binding response OmpR family regulator